MKLSEKGLKRILSEAHYSPEVEVKQEDFVGGVVLSIEEAEEICLAMNPSPKDCHLRDSLAERIAKAREVNE